MAPPITEARKHKSIICCTVLVQLDRSQVRCTRARQRLTTPSNRASSRAAAPKDFTTVLQVSASASVPLTLLSQALETRAAGAM